MEDKAKLIEALLEKATDYGNTSFELIKLKTVDKTSDVVSSFIPNIVVFLLIASVIFFINMGLAFWLGEVLGNICYGFFLVAALYGIIGIAIHFFMHKWIKQRLYDYIIKQVLK